jgi:protoporphyrinogen oxidase
VSRPTVVIIGAGPAGLTAALELLRQGDFHVVVLERSQHMGGLSRTVDYKGNRIDIGGHRFFSKSDRVMDWWLDILPLEEVGERTITYQRQSRAVKSSSPANSDRVMLIRPRKSRIYYLRKFFDYPISLNAQTLRNLGFWRTLRIGASYLRSMFQQIQPEETLEHFMVNRFGRELYQTFFQSYTEKVWGVPCNKISAEWGAQRIKGLSIAKAIAHYFKKSSETSLIEQFMYPKHGPGQLWDTVAEQVVARGGEIITNVVVDRLRVEGTRITAVETLAEGLQERRVFVADHVLSTMPVKELVNSLNASVPANVKEVANGLIYRDFITVGLLLKKLAKPLDDTWIYIQEPDVQVGRVQIFNNWSPALVADPSLKWIGLEYFCYDTDPLWSMSDAEMTELAASELHKIGLMSKNDVLDGTVIRMPKTYPAYFGTYDRFDEIREYLDGFENLFLVGRNGMHKYNNQDHSMLTAMAAVDAVVAGSGDKSQIWAVNTEVEYHETKR